MAASSPTSTTPPQASLAEDPSAPIRRSRSTRSVQFSNPDPTSSRSISPRGSHYQHQQRHHSEHQQQTESSADEITPIVGKERAPRKGMNYDATAQEGGAGSTSRAGDEDGTRRRKRRTGSERGSTSEAGGDEEATERHGWWKDLADKYGSVELDNKGSVARDHLALERTFLAWLRTSLAFASIGIAVTQLFRLNTSIAQRDGYKPSNPGSTAHLRQVGKPLGATFLGIAMLVLLVGGRRYFESQYWIIRGKFPASRGSVFLITGVALALIVTSLVVILVVDPSTFEKK